MSDFIFSHLWGWVGAAGIVVIGCVAMAIIFPRFRGMALAVGAAAVGAASIYAKGQRDRAALEQRRKDEAVAKAKAKYDEIDKRQDTSADVVNRLRKGEF